MACCTGGMAEGAALPRGDTEDTEVRMGQLWFETWTFDSYKIQKEPNISFLQVYRKRSDSGAETGPEDRYRYWLCLELVIIVKLRSRSRFKSRSGEGQEGQSQVRSAQRTQNSKIWTRAIPYILCSVFSSPNLMLRPQSSKVISYFNELDTSAS